MFEDASSSIADLQEHTIESAVLGVAIDQTAKLLGISKRRQRSVNQADNFAEINLGRRTPQLISALGAAHAFHDARIFQLQQNQFQEFFRQFFFIGDIANTDGALV